MSIAYTCRMTRLGIDPLVSSVYGDGCLNGESRMDQQQRIGYLQALGVVVWQSHQQKAPPQTDPLGDVLPAAQFRRFYLKAQSGTIIELFVASQEVLAGSLSRALLSKMMQAAKLTWLEQCVEGPKQASTITLVFGGELASTIVPNYQGVNAQKGVSLCDYQGRRLVVSYALSELLADSELKKIAWQHLQAVMQLTGDGRL